jgi:hypothetical protein
MSLPVDSERIHVRDWYVHVRTRHLAEPPGTPTHYSWLQYRLAAIYVTTGTTTSSRFLFY